ncbi:hypothetical protein [Falsiroseomonas sp. CW058]|uniref:hypothetical protein n=1 Tax=Falsiroseomonas sp. CW058 TaxID=3388664 RepID=UPI003D320B3C
MSAGAFPRLVLTGGGAGPGLVLPQVPMASGARNEAWLRDFLLDHPEVLPAAEIDAAFDGPVAICSELRTPAGPLDALFVNRHGAILLVECKLFRNPQARREVIAQILDYAKELSRWGYADLQAAVSQRLGRASSLFGTVAARHPGLDEAAFVDAVSRNLARGRFLLLVAGDGIRQETEAIAEYVQDHAALRFTLGLMEVRGFALPDGGLLVQPRLLARTREVERIVVRTVDAPAGSEEPVAEEPAEEAAPQGEARLRALAEDRAFWAEFARRLAFDDPAQPVPTPRSLGNARASLGHPDVWVTIYRARGWAQIGGFVRLRGAEGRRIWDALRADAAAIDAAFAAAMPGVPLKWSEWSEGKGATSVDVYRTEAFEPDSAERHLAWLVPLTCALVNVFRPRIRSLLPER